LVLMFPQASGKGMVISTARKAWNHQLVKITKLEADNKKLRKCVEFYAKGDWTAKIDLLVIDQWGNNAATLNKKESGEVIKTAGKLARQTLKELED